MSDRIFGAACIAIAVLYIHFASQTELSFMTDPIGPKLFPYVIGTILGLAGLYPIFRPDDEPTWPRFGRFLEIVFAVAVMIGYTYALPVAGFVVSTAVATTLLSWRMGAGPIAAPAAGIATAAAIYVVFHLILKLTLATGPWGF